MKNLVKHSTKKFIAITMAFILAFGMIPWTNVKTAYADDGNQVYDEDGFIAVQTLETKSEKNVNINIDIDNFWIAEQADTVNSLDSLDSKWSGLLSSVLKDVGLWNKPFGASISWFATDIFSQFLSSKDQSTGPSAEQLLLLDILQRQKLLSNQISGLKDLLTETQCSEILRDFNSENSHGNLYLKDMIAGLDRINKKYEGKFDDKNLQEKIKSERLDALTSNIGISDNSIDSSLEDIDRVTNNLASHILNNYDIPEYPTTSLLGVKTIQQRLQTYWYNQAYDNMENFVNGVLQSYTCLAMLDLLSLSARIEKCNLYNKNHPGSEKHTTMLEVRYEGVLKEMKLISDEFDKYRVVRQNSIKCFWHKKCEYRFASSLEVKSTSSLQGKIRYKDNNNNILTFNEAEKAGQRTKVGENNWRPNVYDFDMNNMTFTKHYKKDGKYGVNTNNFDLCPRTSTIYINGMLESCNNSVSLGEILKNAGFSNFNEKSYNPAKDKLLIKNDSDNDCVVKEDYHYDASDYYYDNYPFVNRGISLNNKDSINQGNGDYIKTYMFQRVEPKNGGRSWYVKDIREKDVKYFDLIPLDNCNTITIECCTPNGENVPGTSNITYNCSGRLTWDAKFDPYSFKFNLSLSPFFKEDLQFVGAEYSCQVPNGYYLFKLDLDGKQLGFTGDDLKADKKHTIKAIFNNNSSVDNCEVCLRTIEKSGYQPAVQTKTFHNIKPISISYMNGSIGSGSYIKFKYFDCNTNKIEEYYLVCPYKTKNNSFRYTTKYDHCWVSNDVKYTDNNEIDIPLPQFVDNIDACFFNEGPYWRNSSAEN